MLSTAEMPALLCIIQYQETARFPLISNFDYPMILWSSGDQHFGTGLLEDALTDSEISTCLIFLQLKEYAYGWLHVP